MKRIISIDPGMSTGVVIAKYDEEALEINNVRQVEGGLLGLSEEEIGGAFEGDWFLDLRGMTIISERFTPRPMQRSYKSAELEPLRIEGYFMAMGLMPFDYKDIRWRTPQSQVLLKGSSSAESKKLSDNLLREASLWHTGKQVGRKDANDVNSAMKHLLSYLAAVGHMPTLGLLGRGK